LLINFLTSFLTSVEAQKKRRQEREEQWRAINLGILILSRTYRLRITEMKKVYEFMLSIVYMALGVQNWDILQSVADIVFEFLKQENVKDFNKK